MSQVRDLFFFTLLFPLVFITACTSTSVTSSWKKSDYAGQPFKSILVVALIDDPVKKMFWENTVADQLRASGVKSVATSIGAFPMDRGLQLQDIIGYVQKQQVDGVLVTRLIDIQTEQGPEKNQEFMFSDAYGHYRNFRDFYPQAYKSAYDRDDPATLTTVLLETNLYSSETLELVWSASSDTFEPRSINKLAASVSQTLIDTLKKDGLL
jgi:hypothetical protein